MPLYIAQSGDLDRCYRCLTHSHLKDSATQLLTKYKSGALVAQYVTCPSRGSLAWSQEFGSPENMSLS